MCKDHQNVYQPRQKPTQAFQISFVKWFLCRIRLFRSQQHFKRFCREQNMSPDIEHQIIISCRLVCVIIICI